MGQAFQIRPEVFSIAGEEDDGFRSVLFLDFTKFSSNGVQGLIPGDRLEFPRTPGASSLQGCLQAVFAVDVLAGRSPFGTERTYTVRVFFAPFHFDNLPVFHV